MLTTLSLKQAYDYYRKTQVELERPGSKIRTGPVVDIYHEGALKLQEEAAEEGTIERFHWPLGGMTIPDESEDAMDIDGNHIVDAELLAWVDGE